MQTAIYCRVSTEEQATEGFSIHAQKDKLTKYANINDWDIVDYYVDDGISGKNLTERPEVSRLIEDVKKGKIKNVLIYKLDRLTRSVKDLIYLIELFDKNNCTFNSQTEKIDTSNAVGRMFVKIIGIFAEFERENLAERVTFGYEQKTREGNYTNCNGVFGYDYIVGKGKLKINKNEAGYVRKIYNWYLEGESMLKIAKKLKDLNVPTKRGGHWNQSTIYSILTNPLYIGNVRYGVGRKNGFEVSGKNIIPIINKELFNNVNNLMKKRKKFRMRKYSSDDTYYSRVLKCSICGSKYYARQQLQSGKKYITYQCNGHNNNSCNAPGFSHIKIENAFINYLDNIKDLEFDKNILKKEKTDINNSTSELKEQINKLNNKKKETIKLFATDEIDYNVFNEIKNVIDEKIEVLNNELNCFNKNNNQEDLTNVEVIKEIVINLKNNFLHLNNHEKKMFLERFIKEIKVRKENNDVIIEEVIF
ncbi:MAG: recombinase family protein [Tenericutes bacterium]|nr:recombinase family protein [Mycoplasmatota bacterium]